MTIPTKNEIYFETLEELREQAINDDVCEEGLEWLDKQKSLKEVFENISLDDMFWCLCKGYIQFADDCDWNKLTGNDWAWLLCEQLQFAEFCNWEKLDGYNWSGLLRDQPQFAEFCNWKKLNGQNWFWLLRKQPQFSNKCDWNKLDSNNWTDLLNCQPQLEKFKSQKIY